MKRDSNSGSELSSQSPDNHIMNAIANADSTKTNSVKPESLPTKSAAYAKALVGEGMSQ